MNENNINLSTPEHMLIGGIPTGIGSLIVSKIMQPKSSNVSHLASGGLGFFGGALGMALVDYLTNNLKKKKLIEYHKSELTRLLNGK
jgi:prolipoprotein diacylglyceryltransferase